MTTPFAPNYQHIIDAASNRRPARVPLYDHGIGPAISRTIYGDDVWELIASDAYADKVEGHRRFCAMAIKVGYDVVPVEWGSCYLFQSGHGLCGHAPGLFSSREEIATFPWDELPARYIERFGDQFRALAEALPPGMKAIGGIGNGIFEVVQDCVPLMELPFLMMNDPDGYALLWQKVGDTLLALWEWFLPRHADSFAVCRMGDDLGFKTSTMLNPDDIRAHILPQYKRIVAAVHRHDKLFLLHSCGCIFDVMEEIIAGVGIDAKHSNEDGIAPFSRWIDAYNDRIGIFGGIDMDLLCRATPAEIAERTVEVCEMSKRANGLAIGCGNSIADYVPLENYLAMTEAVRKWRGDYR